jgi:hypothetical protein
VTCSKPCFTGFCNLVNVMDAEFGSSSISSRLLNHSKAAHLQLLSLLPCIAVQESCPRLRRFAIALPPFVNGQVPSQGHPSG